MLVDGKRMTIKLLTESLNANGALGFSQEHVCLSVGLPINRTINYEINECGVEESWPYHMMMCDIA